MKKLYFVKGAAGVSGEIRGTPDGVARAVVAQLAGELAGAGRVVTAPEAIAHDLARHGNARVTYRFAGDGRDHYAMIEPAAAADERGPEIIPVGFGSGPEAL